jgi:hypothetical protein
VASGGSQRADREVCQRAAEDLAANSRTPFAHPEGFIEAFANIYLAAAGAIADQLEGKSAPEGGYDFPTVDDGVAGMAFIEATVRSSQNNAAWVKPKA